MQLDRIMAVVLRQYYLVRSSATRLIPMFVWVAIDILLWGFISKFLTQFTGSTANFTSMLLGAILLWDFLVRVMQGTTMTFMEDSWSRNFLNLFAAPLTIGEYITGLVISGVASSLIGLVVMLVLASAVFGLSFLSFGAAAGAFLLVLFLFGIALGIIGCALMLRLGPAAEWFVWPIPALLSPFACVFYPLATLPTWMHPIAYLLPPSYVFEAMRAMIAGGQVPWQYLWIATGLSLAYIALSCLAFVRVYKSAVQTGLIARYSAETTS